MRPMKKQIFKYFAIPLLAFFVVNCAVITVNVYFPSEAVEKAAVQIIDEIESGEESSTLPSEGNPQSFFRMIMPHYASGISTVYAENIDLNLTTPAIRKVIESMKKRHPMIKQFKDKGVFGEGNDGTLAIREMGGLGGEDIRTVKRLLRAENGDRHTLYEELAKANNIQLSDIDKIKTVFVKTRREKADPGHWFQDENGKWVQK